MKYILGIESTAHTFGIGIVNDKKEILANIRDTLTVEQGGFLPRDAAEHHYNLAVSLLEKALDTAKIKLKDISLISFSQSPGIGQCLQVGANFARYLSLITNKPIIGVNHCLAHIEIGKITTDLKDPLTIFVSGANTQIIAYKNKKYRIYGETLDIGLGNALDQFGRALNIGFPAGPVLDKKYFLGENYIDLPYTVKGMDLAFCGILTSAKLKIGKVNENDLIFSYLHTLYSMLLEVVERAVYYAKKKEIMVVGGVAASKALRQMLESLVEQRNLKLGFVPLEFAGDNGAMIAWQGYLQYYKANERLEYADLKVDPYKRLDSIKINYIK